MTPSWWTLFWTSIIIGTNGRFVVRVIEVSDVCLVIDTGNTCFVIEVSDVVLFIDVLDVGFIVEVSDDCLVFDVPDVCFVAVVSRGFVDFFAVFRTTGAARVFGFKIK